MKIPSLRQSAVALAFGIIGIMMALGAAELALRVAGFRYQTFPTVQFGFPAPTVIANEYSPDYDLFWVTHDYQQVLTHARALHPSLVFMGDSCTQFGSYPRFTVALLSARHSPVSVGVKVGVGGWSSQQGLTQLKRDILPLKPRIVTIYFGWNDHWIALGKPDGEVHPNRLVWTLSQNLRLLQLWERASFAHGVRASGQQNRVEIGRYRANLEEMATLVRQRGGQAVIITAPANHVPGHEPAYLLERQIRQLSDLVPLHRAYVDATRAAAKTSDATLCDAAAGFEKLPQPHGVFFRRDGIHLTEAGDHAMAGMLAGCIDRAVARLDK